MRERVPLFRSVRVQLVMIFAVSLLGAAAVAWIVYFAVAPLNRVPVITYQPGMEAMDNMADRAALYLRTLPPGQTEEEVRHKLAEYSRQEDGSRLAVLLVDSSGTVLLKEPETAEDWIDPFEVIQTTTDLKADRTLYRPGDAYTAYAPVDQPNGRVYVMLRGVPVASKTYKENYSPAGAIAGLVAFFILFFLLTRGKIRYLEELADGLLVISQGRLAHRVEERGRDELGSLARSINVMAAELERTIDLEREAERTKNELITGVSHDIRTPLTSIKGYLHLLHTHKYESPQQMAQFLRIAYAKAEQLEQLVEELFDYTKLSGQDSRPNREEICMNELLEQMVAEYVPLLESEELTFATVMPDSPLVTSGDPEMLGRLFDNLLTNAVKYSEKPGEIAVHLERKDDGILATVQNRGPSITTEELAKLFTPFFRLDQARSSAVEGSGLGLAIARRIVDLHGGRIWAESAGGLVRCCVWLPVLTPACPHLS